MTALRQAADQVRFVWQHPANADHQLRALLRAMGYQLSARTLGRPSIGRVGQRGRVVVRLHDNGSSQAIYANPSDYAEMTFWAAFLRPGDLFLDVGANVGLYSLWAADQDAEVWAFEPDDEARGHLEENFELSGFAVTVHDCALGSAPGTVLFTEGLGTGNRMAGDRSPGSREVTVRTVDEVVGQLRPRGIKIDVEGAERLVLEGAEETLGEQRVDVLQVEWNHMSEVTLDEDRRPVWELLMRHGYRACRPEGGRLTAVADGGVPDLGPDLFFASPAISATPVFRP